MENATFQSRRRDELLDREQLRRHQLAALNQLLHDILPANAFYAQKLKSVSLPLESLDQLEVWPFSSKQELQQADDFAANRTYELSAYQRFHRTSGTHGRPMIVVDTADDWQWWLDTWQFVLDSALVTAADRVLMAFSFGPFVGFWSANDALAQRGALVVPAGGLGSLARLDLLFACEATVVCCTPSYALRLAEVAKQNDIELRNSKVSRLIVAGEAGGSVPAIRARIEAAWDARVVDHSGATEVGPWGYADSQDQGLHIIETQFLPEFISVEKGVPAQEGELAELVLTTLGRTGCPVVRYRTGDLVRPSWSSVRANRFVFLEGGVLGRADDMLIIRGVNIFPSSIEQILCSFPEVDEYRITATKRGALDAIAVDVEDQLQDPGRIAREFNLRLGLNVDVRAVALGSLPRFEGKGQRFMDRRKQ